MEQPPKELKEKTDSAIAELAASTMTMNASDAMTLPYINMKQLPPAGQERSELLKKLAEYILQNHGAKVIGQIPQDALEEAKQFGLNNHSGKVKVMTRQGIEEGLSKMKKKGEIKEEHRLLYKPEDHNDKDYEKVFWFKKKNAASFVTDPKVEDGIYSPSAERRKINNPAVKHFTLVDKKSGDIIATLMLTMNKGTMAYAADLIVKEELRNKGIAETLINEAFKIIKTTNPEVDIITLIPGGDDDHTHFYDELLGAKPANEVITADKSVIVASFTAPGPELLKEANRDPKTRKSLDPPVKAETVAEVKAKASPVLPGRNSVFASQTPSTATTDSQKEESALATGSPTKRAKTDEDPEPTPNTSLPTLTIGSRTSR